MLRCASLQLEFSWYLTKLIPINCIEWHFSWVSSLKPLDSLLYWGAMEFSGLLRYVTYLPVLFRNRLICFGASLVQLVEGCLDDVSVNVCIVVVCLFVACVVWSVLVIFCVFWCRDCVIRT